MGFLDDLESKLNDFNKKSEERNKDFNLKHPKADSVIKAFGGMLNDVGKELGELGKDVQNELFSGKNGVRWYVSNPLNTSFICQHCLKSILMKKINHITCPHCDTTTESKIGFFLACPECHSKIKYVSCPYCNQDIDLDAHYNHKELEDKRNG